MPEGWPPAPGLHPGRGDEGLSQTVSTTCEVIAPAFAHGTGASRDQLLWTAMNAWAPATTVALLMQLPNRYYFNIDEVRSELASSFAV